MLFRSKSVEFQSDLTITGMVSPEQECVPFVKPVDPKNQNIEFWMGEVRDAMIGKAMYSIIDNKILQ